MAAFLRQSTAVDLGLGPFVDATDGVTAETGLTIAQSDVRLKKNGGAWAQKNNASSATHEESGWYEVSLSTTDTDTLGRLLIAVSVSGALPVWVEFQVVPAVVYDALVAGTDNLDVSVTQWAGSAVATPTVAGVPEVDLTHVQGSAAPSLVSGRLDASVGAMAANVLTASAIQADAITAAKVAADVSLEVADAVWDEARAGHTTAGTFGEGVASVQGSVMLNVEGNVSGNVLGNVEGEVFGVASGGILSTSFATGAINAAVLAADAGTEIASAVWDKDRASHVAAGSFGQGVASVQGNVTGSVGSVTGNVGGNVSGSVGSIASGGIAAASIAAAAANKIADHILRRTYANVRASSDGDAVSLRSLLGGLAKLVNKWSISSGTLTVYHEDDTTSAGTQTVTTNAAADPITSIDTD